MVVMFTCQQVMSTGTVFKCVDSKILILGEYLSELLNPLTQNEYSLTYSFDAANRINRILSLGQENEEYMFVSLDAVSLFTYVPLSQTVNISYKRVYNEKLMKTSLSKR